MKADRTHALTDMPNVGRKVAGLLSRAGISTPEDLVRLGAVEAAVRIREIRPEDPPCRSMVAGLHGAIRGVRWHTIPKDERDALWKEYEARTSPCMVRAGAARP
jgi:DNA transformation protein